MKRFNIVILFVLVALNFDYARSEDGGYFSVGAQAAVNVPLGIFAEGRSTGYGFIINADYNLTPEMSIGLMSGYFF